MKKLGKKLCNFTKVFLVFCLLFSNLSSLKVVFAYEGEEEPSMVEKNEEENEEKLEEDNKETIEENKEEEKEDEEEILEEKSEVPGEENLEEEETELEEEEEKEETEETTEEGYQEETLDEPTEGEIPEEESTVEYDFTLALNASAENLGLSGTYKFADKDSEKVLYVIVGVNESEVEEIVNNAFPEAVSSVVEDSVTVTVGESEATYRVVVYNNEYLDNLMNVVVGNGEATDDDDVNGDGTVDVYDAATLRLMVSDGFGSEVVKQAVSIDAKLNGETNSLTVGDTFTVQYVLSLADYAVDGVTGLINYNKDLLSLDKVDVKNFVDGTEYNGKFLYFGDYIMGEEVITIDDDGNEVISYSPRDYIIVEMTFTAISGGSDTISVSDIGYFNGNIYYEGNETLSKDVTVISNNNKLSSLTIGGVNVPIDELTNVYTITVPNDVTAVDLSYVLSDPSARVTSIVAPEELAVGENTVTITVVAENGEERTYSITVVREGEEEEEETVVEPVSYEDNTYNEDDNNKEEITTDDVEEKKEEEKDEGKLSRVIIIILILLAIAGLIYLIFKDDDEETKKVNRDINKFKKEDLGESKPNKNNNSKKTNKKGR